LSARSILFLTHHFPPEIGGIQTRIDNYMKTLRRMGIKIEVLFFSVRRESLDLIDETDFKVMARPGSISYLPRNLATIVRIAVRERVDVIHVFSGASTLVSIAALALGRALGVPSAISFFGREEFDLQKPSQRVGFPIACALSSSILVNTAYTATLLPRKYQKKARVILGGAEAPHGVLNSSPGKTVLFVGRLVKSKGVDDLVAAFKEVHGRIPDAKLVVVGDGPERRALEQLVESSGMRTSVRFTGVLRGERLESEYQNCAVVVLPSKSVPGEVVTETFGFSLVEGAMHGKPLVGSDQGGIPEIIANNYNGILVPEANQSKLAAALESILVDKESADRLGRNSLRLAEERFTWEAATKRLLDAYEKRSSSGGEGKRQE
jgi:phosphatidylinositol alpha-1,6-mannosyltransferase